MVERIIKHKVSVSRFIADKNEHKRGTLPTITDPEWVKLALLVDALKPCKDATQMLGGERYVSSSILLPQFATLLHLNKGSEDDPQYIGRLKATLCADLRPRYEKLADNMFIKTATLLDPRHKKLKCIKSHLRDEVISHLKNLVKLELDKSSLVRPDGDGDDHLSTGPKAKLSRFDYGDSDDDEGANEEHIITANANNNNQKQEASRLVAMYLSMPTVNEDADPIMWWKIHLNSLTPLATLARQYLACPATSVPSERLFSSAGNIIDKKRASLLPENANALICCANWLK